MTPEDVQIIIDKLSNMLSDLNEILDFIDAPNNMDLEVENEAGQDLASLVVNSIDEIDRAIESAEAHLEKLNKKAQKKVK
jgi:hypothetical protein